MKRPLFWLSILFLAETAAVLFFGALAAVLVLPAARILSLLFPQRRRILALLLASSGLVAANLGFHDQMRRQLLLPLSGADAPLSGTASSRAPKRCVSSAAETSSGARWSAENGLSSRTARSGEAPAECRRCSPACPSF